MAGRIERIELWHVNVPMAAPFWPSWIPGYPQTHVVQTYARFVTSDGLVGETAGPVRRSLDGGRTWQPVQVVYEEGGDQPITIGNPCPIPAADGTIHLLFCRNNRQAFCTKTTDDGRTFSHPLEITATLRPFAFSFTRLGTGPVHGIQTAAGRLLAPLWLNDKIGQDYRSGVAFAQRRRRDDLAGGRTRAG